MNDSKSKYHTVLEARPSQGLAIQLGHLLPKGTLIQLLEAIYDRSNAVEREILEDMAATVMLNHHEHQFHGTLPGV